MPAAIVNALADAGVPMTELPLTPERVWRRIQELKKEGKWRAVRRAAVIGTGTMGPGMGAVLARAGIETALYDVSAEALERAKAGAELAGGVLERLDAAQEDGGALRFETDLAAALDGADFVLEAVPGEARAQARGLPAVRGSTSRPRRSSPRTRPASRSRRSPTVCRAPRARRRHALVEPAAPDPDDRGDPGRADRARRPSTRPSELVAAIGYHPVVEREVPGFVENRILYAILRECLDLVDRGIIDPEGLDLNVRWGIGYKLAVIGPMELLDMAGLDIYNAVGSYLNQDLSTAGEVSSTIRDLIEQGAARHEDRRRHLRLHAGADRRAARQARRQARRRAQGARSRVDEGLAPRRTARS